MQLKLICQTLFELENGVTVILKHRLILSALLFTCFCITKPPLAY